MCVAVLIRDIPVKFTDKYLVVWQPSQPVESPGWTFAKNIELVKSPGLVSMWHWLHSFFAGMWFTFELLSIAITPSWQDAHVVTATWSNVPPTKVNGSAVVWQSTQSRVVSRWLILFPLLIFPSWHEAQLFVIVEWSTVAPIKVVVVWQTLHWSVVGMWTICLPAVFVPLWQSEQTNVPMLPAEWSKVPVAKLPGVWQALQSTINGIVWVGMWVGVFLLTAEPALPWQESHRCAFTESREWFISAFLKLPPPTPWHAPQSSPNGSRWPGR